MSFEIIKTQGTKNSVGAFMVYDSDTDEYLFDAEGNNAWDTAEQALAVLNKPTLSDAEIRTFTKDILTAFNKEIA